MLKSAGGATRHHEPHADGMAARLNGLRAAVLGAKDGVAGAAFIALAVQMVKLWTGRSGPPLSHQ